jgi:hypothetical protein
MPTLLLLICRGDELKSISLLPKLPYFRAGTEPALIEADVMAGQKRAVDYPGGH